ncbi:MAG: cyclic nucleotide-binding domain-containing protein [Alphaproteobacteria bacterium]|nr:cyclic nucleotide-binding domain-containing protein [Alphaproteobacteria bacterium]
MSKKEKRFSAGQILFNQGKPCQYVYNLIMGQVELFTIKNGKEVVIRTVDKDESFGNEDALSGVYGYSARAKSTTLVIEQPTREYISELEQHGQLAPSKKNENVQESALDDFNFDIETKAEPERRPRPIRSGRDGARPPRRGLGRSEDKIEDNSFDFSDSDSNSNKPIVSSNNSPLVKVNEKFSIAPAPNTIVDLKPQHFKTEIKNPTLARWFRDGSKKENVTYGPVLLLASIERDINGDIVNHIYSILRQVPNLQVKIVDKYISDPSYSRASLQMQSWLEMHEADFGMYATLDNAGRILEIYLVNPTYNNKEKFYTRFFLPVDMDDKCNALLKAFTVSVINPTRLEAEQIVRFYLPNSVKEISSYAGEPLVGLNPEDAAVNMVVYANILSMLTIYGWIENKYDEAYKVYKKAIDKLPIFTSEYVFARRQLGLMCQLNAEQNQNVENYIEAEHCFSAALKTVSRHKQPDLYGDLNLRVGKVRQQIASYSGKGTDFADAMQSYRDALTVLRVYKDVEKWADAVNGLAKTMQIFSSYSSKTILLSKSIELYEMEINLIDKEKYPLLWARASNNLASALFLLSDRENQNPSLLRRAVEAFSNALSVYENEGAEKMADITQRNLKRAELSLKDVESELEKKENWFDDLIEDLNNKEKTTEEVKEDAEEKPEEPLVFEKITVFDELDEEE